MDATEKLSAMLDERGVEHYDGTEMTLWLKDEHGYRASANELHSGRLSVHVWCDTPEHAIEATLGRGECRDIAPTYLDFLCSECGFVHYHSDTNDTGDGNDWNFCPNCGRKVRA